MKRFLTVLGLLIVALLGAALGVALGLPAMVERTGLQVVDKVERRLGVELATESLTWTWDGDMSVSGLSVVDTAAGAPPVVTIDRAEIEADVSVFDRKLRVDEVSLTGVRADLRDRPNATNPAKRLVRTMLEMIRPSDTPKGKTSGGASGVLKYLDPTPPEVHVKDLSVMVTVPPAARRLGLTLPESVTLSGADLTLEPPDDADNESLALTLRFAETSLDPGHGVTFSASGSRSGGVERFEARFDRPLRFYLGKRVVGIGAVAWSPDGVVLTDIQLSVPMGSDGATVGAAVEIDMLRLEPEPLTLRAAALAEAERTGGSLAAALLNSIERLHVAKPRVLLTVERDGRHNFMDLLPVRLAAGSVGGSAGAETPLSVLVDAARAASQELQTAQGWEVPETSSLRGTLTKLGDATAARTQRLAKHVGSLLARFPLNDVQLDDGSVYLTLAGEELPIDKLSVRGRRIDGGVELSSAYVSQDGSDKPTRLSVRVQPGGAAFDADIQLPSFALRRVADLLPASVSLEPGALAHGVSLKTSWSEATGRLKVTGDLSVAGLRLALPAVAREPMRNLDVGLSLDATIDPGAETIALTNTVIRRRNIAIDVDATLSSFRRSPTLDLRLNLRSAQVQDVIDALPRELIPRLEGLRADGVLSWPVDIHLPALNIDGLRIDSRPQLHGFRLLSMGRRLDLAQARRALTYRIRRSDGSIGQRTVGPMTSGWVDYADINPYLVKAVTTTEDGSFFRHRGIAYFAIEESIKTNLKEMRYVRGGSTVTQQLVKNLFLDFHKTAGRKIEELFIAWQLEKSLSKQEIMALYLNAIEFGPGIYGIGNASKTFFGKPPAELNLAQCMYLSSIIPSPRKHYAHFTRGRVSDSYHRYVKKLIGVMLKRKRITEQEYLAAAPYLPRFKGDEPEPEPGPEEAPPEEDAPRDDDDDDHQDKPDDDDPEE